MRLPLNNGLFKENLVKYKGKRTSRDGKIIFSSLTDYQKFKTLNLANSLVKNQINPFGGTSQIVAFSFLSNEKLDKHQVGKIGNKVLVITL